MQYTTDVRIIRLMCTGRVDPTMVVDAFIEGADGIMVVGCHFGDCHYISGNYQAKVKIGPCIEDPRLRGSQCGAGCF